MSPLGATQKLLSSYVKDDSLNKTAKVTSGL